MPQFGKKTFPLGWIPSDDEHNGRYDGLLLMENCHLSDLGIVRSFRGGNIVSNNLFENPVNLYSKIVKRKGTLPANCKVGELDTENPLYPAIQQAWAFGEGSGNLTKESKNGYLANINLDGARWVIDEGECSTLEINGGYAYPSSPPALTPMPNGKLNLTPPYPTIEQPVVGPTNHIDMSLISIVVKFRAYNFNNYNKANLSIFTKGTGDTGTPVSELAAKLWFLQQPYDDPPIDGSIDRHDPWMTFGRYCDYDPGEFNDLQEGGFDRNNASNVLNCLDGNWHTLIIVTGHKSDPTGETWHFYVDGVEKPNNLYGGYKNEFEDFYSNEGMSLAIGSTIAGGWNWYPGHALWGQLSTLQFYNRPLTTLEVAALTLDPLRIWLPSEVSKG